MKKLFLLLSILGLGLSNASAQSESAYFLIGNSSKSMEATIQMSKDALTTSGFKIIGEYTVAGNSDLAVVCYTSAALENIALTFPDRGALAAALKIGFNKENDQIKVSMINPMYIFYAYFTNSIDKHEKALASISVEAKNAMKQIGNDFMPFGGTLDKNKLQKYHYKVMMPYFDDAEELNEFSSFDAGLKTIQANLQKQTGETEKVYELIYPEQKVAVFGVALKNKEKGEARFLPIVGTEHVAAMPYEIILQGNTASILPGKYRIALHWPQLTMGTFMKIMSTPGDIKDTMKELTQ